MSATRRQFLGAGVGSAAAIGLGAAFWDDVLGSAGMGLESLRAPARLLAGAVMLAE